MGARYLGFLGFLCFSQALSQDITLTEPRHIFPVINEAPQARSLYVEKKEDKNEKPHFTVYIPIITNGNNEGDEGSAEDDEGHAKDHLYWRSAIEKIQIPLSILNEGHNPLHYASRKSGTTGDWSYGGGPSNEGPNNTVTIAMPTDQDDSTDVYIFMAREEEITDEKKKNPVELPGFYLTLEFSKEVPPETPIITKVSPGDELLFVDYEFKEDNVPGEDDHLIMANHNNQSYPPSKSGRILVRGLSNGQRACVHLFLTNKYFFKGPSSQEVCATPMDIESFLSDSQCFLATAIFGREHFLLGRFRSWRDQTLLKLPLGPEVVSLYYRLGPGMALWAYRNPQARPLIRVFLYAFFLVLEYGRAILIFFLASFIGWRVARGRA